MHVVSDDERRRVAAALRDYASFDCEDEGEEECLVDCADWGERVLNLLGCGDTEGECYASLADLIEPSYKPDAKYESWYNSLSHFGDKRGGPSTIRELIEEIVWAALTVDLGPNGNTDPSTGIDEGDVYTNKQFTEWEREALRLSGGCDRDALLALADELSGDTLVVPAVYDTYAGGYVAACQDVARRIREACGMVDAG